MVQPRTNYGLTVDERQKLEFMNAIAKEISGKGDIVLKGGGALHFGYNSKRFSGDLDFDSKNTPELEKSFKDAAKTVNAKIEDIRIRKNTDTVKRYMVDYTMPGEDGSRREKQTLKVEVSMRNKEFGPQDTHTVNGINVYAIEHLIAQKLYVFEHRSIPRSRDLSDMVFLGENYSNHFNKEQSDKLQSLIRDPDDVAFKFAADHGKNADKLPPLDDLVLRLDNASNKIANDLTRQNPELSKTNENDGRAIAETPEQAYEPVRKAAQQKVDSIIDRLRTRAQGRVKAARENLNQLKKTPPNKLKTLITGGKAIKDWNNTVSKAKATLERAENNAKTLEKRINEKPGERIVKRAEKMNPTVVQKYKASKTQLKKEITKNQEHTKERIQNHPERTRGPERTR